jgi:hypothetical protein
VSFDLELIANSMPRMSTGGCREAYIFAVTALEPAAIIIHPPGNVRITNRITNTEGYLGVFELVLFKVYVS